ncbi:MAG: DUF3307 domain-containing protein [Elusimicrobiaceae bacterium]|nr:DUF3307 domain-containing protein [Elusimicrobiaceae bacterium]MBT3954862.1 DUF3307 domain-containing protein [Elusimicrobiaceae bacterium]MBT4008391.1 DUF3307 domain-containing protein [Elusimicrobiaceae bacterium]MBT4402919.1 DUF3307 domain-containing protein [Elusimicrobiaceae bacterium]MBT4439855.1 DUF3307 domain-containing protein [Elusimicrobiaceae bacterium]
MIIFWRLILAHLLADYVFQTKEFIFWKRNSLLGVLAHSVIHFLTSILLTFSYLNEIWIQLGSFKINGWLAITIITTIHFIIDAISRTSVKYKNKRTLFFFGDQISHFLIIFMFSAPNLFAQTGSLFAEKAVIVIAFLLLTTHFTTFLTYCIESDLFNTTLPFPTLDERYLTIAYRIIFYLLFLLPGYLWIGFILVWLGVGIVVKKKRLIDISAFNFYTAFGLTALFGIIARIIIYYG